MHCTFEKLELYLPALYRFALTWPYYYMYIYIHDTREVKCVVCMTGAWLRASALLVFNVYSAADSQLGLMLDTFGQSLGIHKTRRDILKLGDGVDFTNKLYNLDSLQLQLRIFSSGILRDQWNVKIILSKIWCIIKCFLFILGIEIARISASGVQAATEISDWW